MTAKQGAREDLEQVILGLLQRRSEGASICPSDAARAARPQGWRALMDDVRAAAARLADRGEVEVTQRGRKVDVETARGPIRIRFPE
jgi:anti-sigma factor RsiW